ncbi:HAD family hydrolase [Terrilactibacillus sp. S3-3]|nr:HAD family hydrolase [Terrilactibacillus sp. S3-3]
MRAFENAEAIVFDLDGTLYEGTAHYDYFAKVLSNHIQEGKARKRYLDDYHKMTAWKHPLAIGKVFDLKRQVILTIDPMTNDIERVTEWNGEEWPASAILKTYGKSVAFDRSKFAFVGDGWLLPVLAAARASRDSCRGYAAVLPKS